MCGITGLVSLRAPVDPGVLAQMEHAQRHRGPDGSGIWHDTHAALGNQRLAIVDVDHGAQPTANEDNSIHVVFNGEIYNHRELRQWLSARGHRFRSNSDVEVIPHLYEELGSRFVERLDGDFAIAIWDQRERRLTLTRDRVGVKPLFYHLDGGRLIFASEIKAIFASGLVDVAMDPQGLGNCLFYGHTIAPGTFWVGINELQPGTLLEFDVTGSTLTRWYTPFLRPDPDQPLIGGATAVDRFNEAFTAAVRKRLPDEVRAGIALSGGLDSSAIAGVAAKRLGAPLLTASIALPGEHLDETSMSRHVAESLGVPNDEVVMTGKRAVELLPLSLWHFESPFWYGAVATPFLELTRHAREQGLKVAMSGDGSDELLAGYDFYRVMQLNSKLNSIGAGRLQPMVFRNAAKWLGAPEGIDRHFVALSSRFGEFEARFGEVPPWIYLWSAIGDVAKPLILEALPASSALPLPPERDTLRRQLHFEFHTRLPNWVLTISDRLGMAHGIEVRVPFLDRDVIDVCSELEPSMLINRGREKYVLKRAVRDVVPKAVVTRRKKPFMTPVGPWYLSGAGEALAGDHLSRSAVRRYGLFDPVATENVWRTAVQQRGTWAGMAAEFVSLAVMSTHIVLDQFGAITADANTVTNTTARLGSACCSFHPVPVGSR